MLKKAEAYWPLILLMAIIKFVLPLFLQHPMYELQRDEYLYYQQGLHLDLGYLENPPLIGYLGMISSWMGGSVAWIKLWPCLFGAATVVVTCLITAEMGGKIFAQFIAALGIIGGAYLRTFYLFQPNFLDVFFWTLAIYWLVRYINTKDQRFIFYLAISLALGWWGKYSVLFIMLAILAGLLLSPYKNIFAKKKTWMAVGIAVLIVLPNLVWQYLHKWPLVHHMEELRDTQLKYLEPAGFLKEQLLMLTAVVLIWLAGLYRALSKKQWRVIGIIYLLVIILLMTGSGKGYYALGAYPMLIAAGAVAWEQFAEKRRWIRYVLPVVIIAFNYITLPLLLPTRTPARLVAYYEKIGYKHTWEDLQTHPLPQDYADMLGWKEISDKAETFFQQLPDSIKTATTIYCSNYGLAGSLKFYGKDKVFRDKVISMNGSFLLWIPRQLSFRHMIFIGEKMPGNSNPIFQHFEKTMLIDSVENSYSRQYGNKIVFFENLDKDGQEMARETLKKEKSRFSR